MRGKTFVAWGCAHAPEEDQRAVAVLERFIDDFRPDVNVCLGDLLNMSSVSTFPSEEEYTLRDEYDSAGYLLDRLRPDVWLLGNHEERAWRPGAVNPKHRDLLDPTAYLRSAARGITVFPYDSSRPYRLNDLSFVHGFYHNKHAAMAHAQAYGNVVFAHTHRIQTFRLPSADRRMGWNCGCLLDLRRVQYNKRNGPGGWANGFAYGFAAATGEVWCSVVEVVDGRAWIDGSLYDGR